jgi:hypothetical protein
MTWTASVVNFLLKEFQPCGRSETTTDDGKSIPEPSCFKQPENAPTLCAHQASSPALSWILSPPIESRLHWTGPLRRLDQHIQTNHRRELPPAIVSVTRHLRRSPPPIQKSPNFTNNTPTQPNSQPPGTVFPSDTVHNCFIPQWGGTE